MESYGDDALKKLSEGSIAAFKQKEDAEKCAEYWRNYDKENKHSCLHLTYKIKTIYLH